MRTVWGVSVLLLVGGPIHAADERELECLIEPKVTVALSTPVEGVIEKVHVDRGDFVKRGQVVVELESDVERAVVERARVSLEFAERERSRNEELNRTNVISAQDLDEAQSAEELAKADLERARAALAQRRIRSPVNGVVVKRHHSPGEYADTQPILDIAQVDPLYVEVFAPVSALGSIRPGMRAAVVPEGPLGGSYDATVTVVDPVIDAASGTFGVRLELPNPDRTVPAGLNCHVRFATGSTPAEAPPEPSDDGGGSVPAPEDEEEPALPAVGAPATVVPEPVGPPLPEGWVQASAEQVERHPLQSEPPPAAPLDPPVLEPHVVAAPESPPPEPEPPPAAIASPAAGGSVARATFTTGVVDREPVDSIEVLANDRLEVFFFTELHGMQGQTVIHRWQFKDRVVAEVPFEVRGWRWRVYSSKKLFAGQLGDWSVSVVDSAGNPLETRTFRYVGHEEALR